MNLLFRVVHSSCCRSTHHKLALDALRHLRGPNASRWKNLFLKHYETYLEGSKVPDNELKDFRNHVLHVRDNYWGGAPQATKRWYDSTVKALRRQDWRIAVYDAGIMSHYYTDPIQPFHTGQSEEEARIHRAVEWSIANSYDEILRIIERTHGFPSVEVPDHEDWLTDMVVQGAEFSNPHYEQLIEHYDFDRGVKSPRDGLDQVAMDIVAQLVGHATVGVARILEHAFEDAGVDPPDTHVSLRGFLAALQIPVYRVTRKLSEDLDREQVQAMYQELRRTGRVETTLPEDDRFVRDLHAVEVIQEGQDNRAISPRTSSEKTSIFSATRREAVHHAHQSSKAGNDSSDVHRFYLETSSDVERAPSIGPKTARRLARIGIHTVINLLSTRPAEVARRMSVRHVTPQVVQDWQDQATLVCRVPWLQGHDAELLVAGGWRTAEALAAASPQDVLDEMFRVMETAEGRRILRGGKRPDLANVTVWVRLAHEPRSLKAA